MLELERAIDFALQSRHAANVPPQTLEPDCHVRLAEVGGYIIAPSCNHVFALPAFSPLSFYSVHS